MDTPDTLRAGSSVLPNGFRIGGRYLIDAVIGEGAFGVVYRAHREPDGERVALKSIHRHLCSDPQIFKRFQREADILKRIEGQHLAKVHEILEDNGLVIIVLEYVEGPSLEAILKTSAPELDQAVEITLQVCAALGAAHAAGVVHRDLKPANVIVERFAPRTTGLRVRVVDFGLAKVVHGDAAPGTAITQRGMIFGTPEYMAPEQVRGDEVDLRADLYAAGVMLYEMVVGKVPFSGKSALATMEAHVRDEVPHPRSSRGGHSVPPSLAAVIRRALEKDPQARYPSARAFAEALTAAWSERLVITPNAPTAGTSIQDLETIDTELNLAEDARAAVKAAEAIQALPTTKALAMVTAPVAAPRILGDPPKAAKTKLSEPDPAGTTLRSAKNDAIESSREGAIRSRPAPEIRIEDPPPRPGGKIFWILAIVVAIACILVGIWIGSR
ncbi:MAG: serine/threonine protein kinase [Polyangiaceae bacterium]|nr:serine/threonine protein kinase [Polyangiaceae bacterium]